VALISAVLLGAAAPGGAEPTDLVTIPEKVVLRDWLVLPPVGETGRTPFQANPIPQAVVEGTWSPPVEGAPVDLGPGKQAVWVSLQAPADAPLGSDLLRGGWAYTRFDSDARQRVLLHARGHSIAYVNGVPRVTNVYRTPYVKIPVLLKEGANHFLFRCVRYGTIEARLEPVTHDVMINPGDYTIPEAVRGDVQPFDAGVVVINTTTSALDLAAAQGSEDGTTLALPSRWMPPLSIAKVPVRLPAQPAVADTLTYEIRGERISPATLRVAVVEPGEYRNVTFRSKVEGSVQYYGFRPPRPPLDDGPPALMLHLHGGGDEAFHYREKYYEKTWCAIACATNRRPFGFSWEDWGRVDAIEVLDHTLALSEADPRRVYLGGHSMGGHGVWINGAIFPDRFAAIGPGAGWQDYWTYTGAAYFDSPQNPVQEMLNLCTNTSRPALLADNYKQMGVLIIHGDADQVVSIDEAYAMRDLLDQHGHDDLTMSIEPGGGHVYDMTPEVGYSCFDHLELFEFFQRHSLPAAPQRIDFTTVLPSINDRCHWARVEQQVRPFEPSRVQLQLDPGRRTLFGSLENVARFSVDPSALITPGKLTYLFGRGGDPADHLTPDGPVPADAATGEDSLEWTGEPLHFHLGPDGWQRGPGLDLARKGPHRGGSMKTVLLANDPILVVGTGGTAEENQWALHKARYDNETMWYRGNSSFTIVLDTDFDPKQEPDRNVLLYGNADTNRAWDALLPDSPVSIRSGEARVGDRVYAGPDLAAAAIRPRPGSSTASVAFLGGTGIVGMRAVDDLSILYARVFRPDFAVFSADCWTVAEEAVRAVGFFGNDWHLWEETTAYSD